MTSQEATKPERGYLEYLKEEEERIIQLQAELLQAEAKRSPDPPLQLSQITNMPWLTDGHEVCLRLAKPRELHERVHTARSVAVRKKFQYT